MAKLSAFTFQSASLTLNCFKILSTAVSYIFAPIKIPSVVYSNLTSVLCDGLIPGLGDNSVKFDATGAFCHTPSSKTPSILGLFST